MRYIVSSIGHSHKCGNKQTNNVRLESTLEEFVWKTQGKRAKKVPMWEGHACTPSEMV